MANIVDNAVTTDQSPNEENAAAKMAPPPSRDELRKKFFSEKNTKVAPVELSWNGISFEWRRPTISQIQAARDANEDGSRNFIVDMIIGYSFIEGTDEKLFDESDYETVINMPFSGEFQEIVTKIGSSVNMNVEEKAKN